MKTVKEKVDLVVAGGGTAGHIAAIQAARLGIKTSVIEANAMLGGTMTEGGVHTPCYFHSKQGPVVLGIPWELYQKSKHEEGITIKDYRNRRPIETPGPYSYINVPIYVCVAEEEAEAAGVIFHYHEIITEVKAVGNEWEIISLGRGVKRITRAKEVIDCTGNADVVRLLGLDVFYSRVRQPATYIYKLEGIDLEQVWEKEVQVLYEEALTSGELKKGDFAYPNMLPFKYFLDQGGYNATHVYESDTSTSEGQTIANIEGRQRLLRMLRFLRAKIPGCENVTVKWMAPHAVGRETYRIKGELILRKTDFMQAVDFEDKVCNCFNYIDMHSQAKGCEVEFLPEETLVPKIPFRALIPKNSARITVAGRILSADRVAFAGARAQCSCMAMGQAMGAAAALAIRRGVVTREVNSRDIVAVTIEHGAAPV